MVREGEEGAECRERVWWELFVSFRGAGLGLRGGGLLGVGVGGGLLGVESSKEVEKGVVWVGHVCLSVCVLI